MIYIEVDEGNGVPFIHTRPFDEKYGLGKSTDELRLSGVLVDALPEEPEAVEGMQAVLKYDGSSLIYEMEELPATPGSEIDKLRNDLNDAIMELSLAIAVGGMPNV